MGRAVCLVAALGLALGAVEGPLRLETLAGEPAALGPPGSRETLLVHFFATWCRDCDGELATLQSLAPRCDGRGVRILAVDAGEDRELVRRFVDERGLRLEVLLDPGGRAWRAATGGAGLPANLVWTAQGTRVDVGARTRAAWEAELAALGCSLVELEADADGDGRVHRRLVHAARGEGRGADRVGRGAREGVAVARDQLEAVHGAVGAHQHRERGLALQAPELRLGRIDGTDRLQRARRDVHLALFEEARQGILER
jgi:thiol-disulfide isomerase/thioredoxin